MDDHLPPGPKLPGWVQALFMVRSADYVARCHRRYGDRFTLRLGRFGTLVYLADPDDIRGVFRGDPETFHAGEANATILAPVLGPLSVLVTDEDTHLRQRKLMMPSFHGDAVARQTAVMAEIAAAEVATWPIGQTVSLLPRMRAITLEVILRTVIGVNDVERLPQLRHALPALVDLDNFMMLQFVFPRLRRVWPWSRFRVVAEQADSLLREEIDRCRQDPTLDERVDVLAMLIRSRDEDGAPMTTAELRDQLTTLLLAGHETTATALAWAFERLVRHPSELTRAQQAAADGDDAYLDAVVAETLRIRPVVPDVSRRLTRPYRLGEHLLPAGTFVDPAIALVQRSPQHYSNPEAFAPDRFVERRPDPSVWLPFGGGNRRCLGATFAATELRVVLREVLRRVDLAPTDAAGERTRIRHVTLVPKAGAQVTVLRRHPAAVLTGP